MWDPNSELYSQDQQQEEGKPSPGKEVSSLDPNGSETCGPGGASSRPVAMVGTGRHGQGSCGALGQAVR